MAHFWRKLPSDLKPLKMREYRQLELFAAQAIKSLDVATSTDEKEVPDG